MKDKKILFGTFIVLLLILTTSLSYAYFSTSVSGNNDAKDVVVETGTLKLTYTDSPQIIMQNIKPGTSITKEVTVKNTGTLDTAYNLVWQELYNKIGRNDLVMSYTCERLNSSDTVDGTCAGLTETPVKTKTITKNIPIESGITHKYTVTITFKETGENQNYNQGKSFSGVLGIEEYSKIVGTLKNKFYEESGMTDRSLVKSISFYSNNRVIDGAESYDVSESQDESVIMYVKQNSENSSLYDLSIVGDGIIAFPEDSSSLLAFNIFSVAARDYISSLSSIDFNNSIDTSNVTDMSGMFHYSQTTTIDLSSFDTHNVTNMSQMFYSSPATSLDLSNFDTSKVTDMSYMFSGSKATELDLSNFDTSNVIDMGSMFFNSKATELDLSNFDTSKVTDMSYMFSGSKATELDLSNFDTSNVIDMGSMFFNSKATILDLSNFDTSKVTDMSSMFGYSALTTLDLSNFDTSNVTNMAGMFQKSQATTLDLSSFDTSNVTNMSNMFYNNQATTLDLSNFDTSKVKSMYGMFWSSQTTAIDLSNFDTSKVTDMSYMFSNSKVTTLDLSNFNTSKVTSMFQMFGDSQAATIDLSSFDTSKVTDMRWMFSDSKNLKTIYVNDKFNTDAVTESTKMFYECTSLVGGSGTKYNSSYIDKTYARIDGGTSNPGYFTSK